MTEHGVPPVTPAANRPMHIAMYVAAWPLGTHSSGILTYADSLRSELSKQGHRLSIFASKLDANESDTGLYRVQLSLRDRIMARLRRYLGDKSPAVFGFGDVIARHMFKVHQTDPIDVVEIEESFGFAGQIARALPVPVVVKLHGPEFLNPVDEEKNSPLGQERIRLEGEALLEVAAVIAPARCTLAQTLEHYKLRPSISEHVINPLAPESGEPLWSLEGCDKQTVLFVGRFDRRKGADAMLLAFQTLLKTHPSAKLMFVGPDNGLPLSDGRFVQFDEYRRSLFSDAQAEHIQFLGRRTPAEINVLRTQAMVTVVASRWENQSYATLEAMLQGCPVVCVDAGGQGELVTHGVSGLLARKDDVADLCAQLAYVLDNPDKGREFGVKARTYVLENHHPSLVADKTIAVYRRAISAFKKQVAA